MPCARDSYPIRVDYEQAWLEVDEAGFLWDLDQLTALTERIAAARTQGMPVMLAVYVHGWNGNADERGWDAPACDALNAVLDRERPGEAPSPTAAELAAMPSGQVEQFHALMGRAGDNLQRLEAGGVIRRRPQIIGVWVGWRGRDFTEERLSNRPASFISRAQAATEIGRARGMSESRPDHPSLQRAMQILADSLTTDDRMLLMGLSFGGRIISHMFIEPPDRSRAGDPGYPLGPRTLIVTVNPAIGADCYDAIRRTRHDGAIDRIGPGWINVSSEEDGARSGFYSIGSPFLPRSEACLEAASNRNLAVGFDGSQVTHDLTIGTGRDSTLPFAESFSPLAWSTTPARDHTLAYNEYSRPGAYRNAARLYPMRFWSRAPDQEPPPVWLVNTDTTVIAFEGDPSSLNSRHSAVFQTNLTRLIMNALYDPARGTPR